MGELGSSRHPKVSGSIKYGSSGTHTCNPSNLAPTWALNPDSMGAMVTTKATSMFQAEELPELGSGAVALWMPSPFLLCDHIPFNIFSLRFYNCPGFY